MLRTLKKSLHDHHADASESSSGRRTATDPMRKEALAGDTVKVATERKP